MGGPWLTETDRQTDRQRQTDRDGERHMGRVRGGREKFCACVCGRPVLSVCAGWGEGGGRHGFLMH